MADQQFTDVNGNPIVRQTQEYKGAGITDKDRQNQPVYTDVSGKPYSIRQGLGLVSPGSQVPDVKGKVEGKDLPNPADSAPYLGRFAVEAMPAIGAGITGGASLGLGSVPGAIAGSFIKRGLQQISPKYFGGGEPASLMGDAADTAIDTIGAGLLPQGLTKLANGAVNLATTPAKETAANILSSKLLKNTTPVQNAVTTDIGKTVDEFTGGSFSQQTNPQMKATRDLFSKGASASGRLNTDKILDEMKLNPDSYGAIPKETQDNVKAFLTQAKSMQGDSSNGSLISMIKNKAVLALPGIGAGSLLGGLAGHGYTGAAIGAETGIVLGESAISKLMANPEIAKLTIQAMKTPQTAESSKILSKVILNGLRGTEVFVMTPEGKQERAQVSQDGQLTYPKP